nr:Chain C, Anastral spindle 2 [Drosophila melanogaster]4QH7_D Chain D, Anastral spindle 2 [Drosophila melanogaster]4QH7_G Chain G, Anastral spindle 2 [Drosophila melanogaster]4QH7_H Chain H, Anastral spindle 2 [Drosophila melanogaster]
NYTICAGTQTDP